MYLHTQMRQKLWQHTGDRLRVAHPQRYNNAVRQRTCAQGMTSARPSPLQLVNTAACSSVLDMDTPTVQTDHSSAPAAITVVRSFVSPSTPLQLVARQSMRASARR